MGCAASSCCKKTGFPDPPSKYPDYVSSPVEGLHVDLIQAVCILLLRNGCFFENRRGSPPFRFRQPEELLKLVDCEIKDSSSMMSPMKVLGLLRKIVYYSPQFCHPYYMYQLLAGLDPYSMVGDWVSSLIPSTMTSYREAPVYYMMEEELCKQFQKLSGYPEDSFDMIYPPGCNIANCLSIVMARHNRFPESKTQGTFHLPPLVIYVSQDAHGCFKKGAIYGGIGEDNVVPVKVDAKGKMMTSHLKECVEASLKEGKVPLMVGGTSGSNWCGAFDPLDEIGKICKQYNMWLHSDGALGGGIIFSDEKRKKYLPDLGAADSIGANFHKTGSANQTSTILMTRHRTIFRDAFGMDHPGCSVRDRTSIPQEEGGIEEFFRSDLDVSEKYMEHTRRPDVVKLFFMWKAKGQEGLGANIDNAYDRTKFFVEEIKRRQKENGRFSLIMEELECPLVPFFWVPDYLKDCDKTTEDYKERLNLHTSLLFAEVIKKGIMVITVQSLRTSPLFWKVILHNSAVTNEDIVYLLDQLDNFGTNLKIPGVA